jgi:transcription elongation GreA/GreB family factor
VTTSSPLGRVLVGASKDQEIVVKAPGGSFKYIVVGFEPFVG